MDIGEAVGLVERATEEKEVCDQERKGPFGWKARIDGYGATPTAKQLLKNMVSDEAHFPENTGLKKKGGKWDLETCDKANFPFQTHHLLPKKHLPKHLVCAWLTAKCSEHPQYKLKEDTDFDTDHSKNGYCMPFASNTAQWKKAGDDETQKMNVCIEMMAVTGIQLHQGSHNYTDFMEGVEDEDIEYGGYLDTVDLLLDAVSSGAGVHVKICPVCKEAEKTEILPRESVVNHMYLVSNLLKDLIDSNRIFVSERAALYHKSML